MEQAELVRRLDAFFAVHVFDERDNWRPVLSDADYRLLTQVAVPSFINGPWNGLMLDNARAVDKVYLVVFPAQEVLDTIIAREVARGAPGAMIFAHHLADFEESGRGFVHISEVQLEELREHHISYYNCHAPLDGHREVSTASALANALGLRDQGRFAPYYGGLAGAYGTVGNGPITFQAFAARLAKVTDVDRLRYDQVRHNGQPVNRVAVVPGGGGDVETIEEAAELDCDTYVTGHWWLFNKSDFSEQHRAQMRDFIPTVRMNLLASSHYATEMVVMRDQMPAWFRELDVETELIRQADPWR